MLRCNNMRMEHMAIENSDRPVSFGIANSVPKYNHTSAGVKHFKTINLLC